MGRHYCEECDVLLEDYGNVEWNSCQNNSCPAIEKAICCRCADTDKPICGFCESGDSCSMCLLVSPHTLEEDRDGYQEDVAQRCECDECPIYEMLDAEDRCLNCWDRFANSLDTEVFAKETCEVWTIGECGHQLRSSKQMLMMCTDETECSICKEKGIDAGEEEERRIEGERIQSDLQLMTGFMSQATSSSAKAALNEWLIQHDTPQSTCFQR
jgi:hypothetical protein